MGDIMGFWIGVLIFLVIFFGIPLAVIARRGRGRGHRPGQIESHLAGDASRVISQASSRNAQNNSGFSGFGGFGG